MVTVLIPFPKNMGAIYGGGRLVTRLLAGIFWDESRKPRRIRRKIALDFARMRVSAPRPTGFAPPDRGRTLMCVFSTLRRQFALVSGLHDFNDKQHHN